MTPRIDSRLTESDSAPDSERDPIPEIMEETKEYGKPANKPRRFSETAITTETKDAEARLGRLNLDDICEECKIDSRDRFKSKMQYSKPLNSDRNGKVSPRRSPKKSEPFSFKEKDTKKGTGSITPRKQKEKLSLPKIS